MMCVSFHRCTNSSLCSLSSSPYSGRRRSAVDCTTTEQIATSCCCCCCCFGDRCFLSGAHCQYSAAVIAANRLDSTPIFFTTTVHSAVQCYNFTPCLPSFSIPSQDSIQVNMQSTPKYSMAPVSSFTETAAASYKSQVINKNK